MPKRKLVVYFSCALSGLSPEHRAKMVELRNKFQKRYKVLEFCGPETPAGDLYRHDIHHCVRVADFLICICDERSTGLGYEMGTGIEKYRKPAVAFARREALVSKVITGIDYPDFSFLRYDNVSQIEKLVYQFEERFFG